MGFSLGWQNRKVKLFLLQLEDTKQGNRFYQTVSYCENGGGNILREGSTSTVALTLAPVREAINNRYQLIFKNR